MSVYFFSTAWIFAENPSELDLITNEKMIELAAQSPGTASKEAKKERAAQVEERHPHMIKLYAGGSLGQCMCATELSELHPNLLFIVTSGADCTDELTFRLIKNGKSVFKGYIFESEEKTPPGFSFAELELIGYDKVEVYNKVKTVFDDILKLGMDFMHGDLENAFIDYPPLGMED